jgi:predicted ferric reductase
MRLTSKDVIGTGLAVAAVFVAAAVINVWQWPLLGDYRAGTVALAIVGIAMCAAASDYSNVRWSHPLVLLASALGIAALGLIVAGLIWATAELVFWLAAVIVGLWFVSTLRHVITPRSFEQARPALS